MKSVAEGEKNRLEERGERLLISKLVRNVQTESLAEMNRPVIVLQSPDSLLFNDIFSSSRSEKIFVFRDLDILLTQLREDPLYLKKMLDLIKGESIERQKGLGELFQSNFSLDQLIKLRSWELPFVNWR